MQNSIQSLAVMPPLFTPEEVDKFKTREYREKVGPTPKAPQNRMTRHQRRQFKQGKFDFKFMAWYQRPDFAKIQ